MDFFPIVKTDNAQTWERLAEVPAGTWQHLDRLRQHVEELRDFPDRTESEEEQEESIERFERHVERQIADDPHLCALDALVRHGWGEPTGLCQFAIRGLGLWRTERAYGLKSFCSWPASAFIPSSGHCSRASAGFDLPLPIHSRREADAAIE